MSTYTVVHPCGRRFAATNDRGQAMRLAHRLDGTVTTTLFGEVVTVGLDAVAGPPTVAGSRGGPVLPRRA